MMQLLFVRGIKVRIAVVDIEIDRGNKLVLLVVI